jgi:hypothetical protein
VRQIEPDVQRRQDVIPTLGVTWGGGDKSLVRVGQNERQAAQVFRMGGFQPTAGPENRRSSRGVEFLQIVQVDGDRIVIADDTGNGSFAQQLTTFIGMSAIAHYVAAAIDRRIPLLVEAFEAAFERGQIAMNIGNNGKTSGTRFR